MRDWTRAACHVALGAWLATAAGCAAPWQGRQSSPPPSPTATATTAPSAAPPTSTPGSAPPAAASPTESPAATPSPRPTPPPAPVDIAACCGVFAWVDGSRLLVYDAPPGRPAGAVLVDVATGARTPLAAVFGQPSSSGLIALSDPAHTRTEVRRLDGTLVGAIGNGGARTWVSPDGRRAVWLQRLPRRTPSSSVNRAVRLWVAGVDGRGARAVLDLEAASLAWLPDDRRLVLAARAIDGGSAGVWVLDVDAGAYRVLLAHPFVQSVRLSPDGRRVALLQTFTSDPARDGVLVADVDGGGRWHLEAPDGFRWHGDGRSLWTLRKASDGSGTDQLIRVDIEAGPVGAPVSIGGRVRQDAWDVSPDGRWLAFWDDGSGRVRALPLPGS